MTKVFILENQQTSRHRLCEYIKNEPSLSLEGSAGSLAEGLLWLSSNAPDVMLVDLQLQDGTGFEAIHACRKQHPNCDVLVLTESDSAEDALASIYAGAMGYVVKGHGFTRISEFIQDMLAGGSPISPSIARALIVKPLHAEAEIRQTAQLDIKLSEREAEVLRLLSEGLTYPEISKELNVKASTVPEFIKRLYRKMSVNSRHQAVVQARRRGMLM